MENSIENIWKTGFVDDKALSVPKVSNLYNRKSNDVVEHIMRLLKYNIWGLYIFAFAFLLYSFFSDVPLVTGLVIFALFMAAGLYTKSHIGHLISLDRNVNSYEYLKSFKGWLNNRFRINVKIARIFYPVTILASISMVWYAEGREELVYEFLQHFPNHVMIGNVPLIFLLFVIIFPSLFIIFTKYIYMFDIKLVYGRVFKKLDNIIADLEELRGE